MLNESNILNLSGFMSPRAAMSIIPKITRSKSEQHILKIYVEKAVKRTNQEEVIEKYNEDHRKIEAQNIEARRSTI